MGCFCRHLVLPPDPGAVLPPAAPGWDAALQASLAVRAGAELRLSQPSFNLLGAVSDWLAARWLPPGPPWTPDPAWLDLELPVLAATPETLSVLLSLASARVAVQESLGLDVAVPASQLPLARIVATLNLRLDPLRPLALDTRPWVALARLNAAVDRVVLAAGAGLFVPLPPALPPPPPPNPAWRLLLARLLRLAPLVALGNLLRIDLGEPGALASLSDAIRPLVQLRLPKLADPGLLLAVLARNDAVARLHASLGVQPFRALVAAVVAKADAAAALLPPGLTLTETGLAGMPPLLPNLEPVVNAATVGAAGSLSPSLVAGLNWQAPPYAALPLLTAALPVATLVANGLGPVRPSPCDQSCDAAAVARVLAG